MFWNKMKQYLKSITGHLCESIHVFDELQVAIRRIEQNYRQRTDEKNSTKNSNPVMSDVALENLPMLICIEANHITLHRCRLIYRLSGWDGGLEELTCWWCGQNGHLQYGFRVQLDEGTKKAFKLQEVCARGGGQSLSCMPRLSSNGSNH